MYGIRRILPLFLAVLVGVTGLGGTAAAEGNVIDSSSPTDAARAAGIEAEGDAYMGWSLAAETPDGTAPDGTGGSAPAPLAATTYGLQTLPTIRQVGGVDVSHWQWDGKTETFDWNYWRAAGYRFAYVKATEGLSYRDTRFADSYNGSYQAGLIRGAYHFARPNISTGAAQADYFVRYGGGWSADGKTLPGALDIEHNPYGAMCYGLSPAQMRGWIASFTQRYFALTGRHSVIYTSPSWWEQCTGNTTDFADTNPLWLAHYTTGAPRIPGGWTDYLIWQHGVYNYKILQVTDSKGKTRDEKYPIDLNEFNGTLATLQKFALGETECTGSTLTDINAANRFCLEIGWLAESGISAGYSDGTFRPGAPLTRQAMAAFLYRMASTTTGASAAPCTVAPFRDVPVSHPFCAEITWLAGSGVTSGYSDGTFRPGAPLSRQAMGAFLHRMSGAFAAPCTVTLFRDVPVSHPFCAEITWLAENRITRGYDDGQFKPADTLSRQAMAAFLYRYAMLQEPDVPGAPGDPGVMATMSG